MSSTLTYRTDHPGHRVGVFPYMANDDGISYPELAARVGRDVRTLRRWVAMGKIPEPVAVRRDGSRVVVMRFARSVIERAEALAMAMAD